MQFLQEQKTVHATVHPEHRRSLPSMAPRHTFHPEHMRSLPSMAPRYTVHPEHKKPGYAFAHRALIFRFSEQLN